jgi:RNA-directed DNA polymerase
VSFASAEALLDALPDQTRQAHQDEIVRLFERGLPPAVSLRTVSTLFGVSAEFIGAMSQKPSRYYRTFKIKKGRKTRVITAPRVALKLIQSWIGWHLARSTFFPECVFGFVPGKDGVKGAAAVHCGSNWVYSIDLRDFFPNISADRVVQALRTIGYSERASAFLVRLVTLNGHLPQGSPASPVISNIAFAHTDLALSKIAVDRAINYTRYADDLVFSGSGEPPTGLADVVRRALVADGWTMADEKEHLAVRPARLKVHGLLVHGTYPRLTKGYRNKIRAFQHLLNGNKIDEKDLPRIRGHLAYARHINDQ